jgi:NitT/TauT family transport system permease protein
VKRGAGLGRLIAAPFVGLGVFLGGWELLVRLFDVDSFKLPRPSTIVRYIAGHLSPYWYDAWPTIKVSVVGFLVAFVVAFVVAAVCAQSAFIERAVSTVAVLILVTPLFAYAAAIVLWMGLGSTRPIIVMVAIVCFPPMLFNAIGGLRDVDRLALELLQSVHASRWEIFRRLRVPSSVPSLLSGAKVSAGLAIVGAVIGEPWAFRDRGMGIAIKQLAAAGIVEGATPLWGSIFVLGLIGSFAYLAISGIERAALHWHGTSSRSSGR